MNNLLSYCWLVDARISASEKYLPVLHPKNNVQKYRTKGYEQVCYDENTIPTLFLVFGPWRRP
jgi:hypothetical protein